LRKPLCNNRIRAEKVRLIDSTGKQIGIVKLEEALRLAKERGLDLVQVSEKTEPPVCKIMDYGKYLYSRQKKGKAKKAGQLKTIRLTFNISEHDLNTRVKQAQVFLEKGNKIRAEMVLRGRQKALSDFAKGKLKQFLETLNGIIPIKIERQLKKEARGLTIIISKK